MKVAVEGCCHGELDKIYETLQCLEQANRIKVDVLLICGDFQAVRNRDDLKSMAVPQKHQKLNTFHKYYSGEKVAPVLTIFIGGNHEASNYMQELPYGGWVAKNIYYMGYANVIQVGGLRIGGLSGIFKDMDYHKGHHECPPYTEDTKRSVYHVRSLEVFRLKQLTRPLDIILSHDWPTNVARHGNLTELFKKKPFLKREILKGSLGSPPAAEVLHKLQPSYWFSAHLHVKYAATVTHSPGKCTQFLSLDKCLPRRQFLQVIDIPAREAGPVKIKLDPEWLCVLQTTNHLLNLERRGAYMPGPGGSDRFNFEVSDKDMENIQKTFGGDLTLPENFERTAPTLRERNSKPPGPMVLVNPQTTLLCTMLNLTDPNSVHLGLSTHDTTPQQVQADEEEEDIDSNDDAPSDVKSSLHTSNINSNDDAPSDIKSSLHTSNINSNDDAPSDIKSSLYTSNINSNDDAPSDIKSSLYTSNINSNDDAPSDIKSSLYTSNINSNDDAPSDIKSSLYTSNINSNDDAPSDIKSSLYTSNINSNDDAPSDIKSSLYTSNINSNDDAPSDIKSSLYTSNINSNDDAPSDIKSSLHTSNINSRLDASDSFSGPRRKNLSSQCSAGDGAPPVRIDDDDQEFKAILAAQRQNSQQGRDTSVHTDKPGTDKNTLSEKIDNSDDDMAAIMAAQKRKQEGDSDSENFHKLTVDSASSQEKSSSDIDSTSRPSGIKRKSPDAISSSSSLGKKLKRRNV